MAKATKPGRQKGQPRPHKAVSREKLAAFRAHYLYSGVASESARELGIPERTGRDIAAKLAKDETFASECRDLHARALTEHAAMRLRVTHGALARFEGDLPTPEIVGEGANITIIDKRPDYGKLVLEAEKNAIQAAKIHQIGDDSGAGPAIVINLTGTSAA